MKSTAKPLLFELALLLITYWRHKVPATENFDRWECNQKQYQFLVLGGGGNTGLFRT